MSDKLNIRQAILKLFVSPAMTEHHWGYEGRHRHRPTTFDVERYIWRTEDVQVYRVAIPESFRGLTQTKPGDELSTKTLEYVPTGRIRYVNDPRQQLVLFEYRLREARETQGGLQC